MTEPLLKWFKIEPNGNPASEIDSCIPPIQNIRILLVEDNMDVRLAFEEILNGLDCQTTLAADGYSALRQLLSNTFDLVLIDCGLPGISGYQVVKAFRKSENKADDKRLPIIAISANSGKEIEKKCLSAGMDALLSKPFELSALRPWLLKYSKNSCPIPVIAGWSPEVIQKAGKIFLDNLPKRVEELVRALQEKQWEEILRITHSLKGSALLFQMKTMNAACLEIERLAKVGNSETIDQWVSVIRSEYQALLSSGKEPQYAACFSCEEFKRSIHFRLD